MQFVLAIPLLWTYLTALETPELEKVKHAMGTPSRVKRGWVWNQFFVPEEMNTSHLVGQVFISNVIAQRSLNNM